jgi:hypothetical protein
MDAKARVMSFVRHFYFNLSVIYIYSYAGAIVEDNARTVAQI